jgi:carnitine 3-dehydrogenase
VTLSGKTILILGGGTIGAGWAACFAAAGARTLVCDPDPAAAGRLAEIQNKAHPVLQALGLPSEQDSAPEIIPGLADLNAPVDFVVEALPERMALKTAALAALEDVIPADTVIASSSSGLSVSDMQTGMRHPDRLVIGHPCNPPYLMPVVELVGGAATAPWALDRAAAIFQALGKRVLRLNRELPGHLVNRLQAALWREAVHLAAEGVASVGDIEAAITKGLGPRWAVVGPTEIFHLAGGPGGIAKFFDDLGDEVERWWESLGDPRLDSATRAILTEGMAASKPPEELAAHRDAMVPRVIAAADPDAYPLKSKPQ